MQVLSAQCCTGWRFRKWPSARREGRLGLLPKPQQSFSFIPCPSMLSSPGGFTSCRVGGNILRPSDGAERSCACKATYSPSRVCNRPHGVLVMQPGNLSTCLSFRMTCCWKACSHANTWPDIQFGDCLLLNSCSGVQGGCEVCRCCDMSGICQPPANSRRVTSKPADAGGYYSQRQPQNRSTSGSSRQAHCCDSGPGMHALCSSRQQQQQQ